MIRVVTALSGLVLIVLALRLAMAPLFPLDKFVAPSIAAFEAETGTAVKYGAADLTLLPTPSVVASDVAIDLPDGLGNVHAARLFLALNPLPFLSGSAELASVTVERPTLSLAVKGGDLDPAKVIGALTELASRATDRHFLATDGRLVISAGGAEASLDGVAVSATRTDSGDRLIFKTMLHDTPLSLTIEAGTTGAMRAQLTIPALSAGLDGGVAGGAFAGRLDLSVPDTAALGGPFAVAPGAVELNGAITLSSGRAEMVNASATVLGSSGRLSAALDLGAPRASADLHADFARLPAQSLATLAALAARLGFDPVGGHAPFDAGIDLKLAELTLPGGQIHGVRLTAVDREGRFGALFDAMAGKGTLSSRLDLVPDGDGRRLGASFAVKDIEVGEVLSLAGLAASPLSGRLAADLRLSAHGRSTDELAATIAVDGAGQLRDGRLGSLPLASGIVLPALTGISADLSVVGLDKPAQLTGQATAPSGVIALEAAVPPRRLIEGGAAPVEARLNGPILSAGFDGDIDPMAFSANGSLTLASRQLPMLAGVAGLPAEASLDGQLEAGAGRMTLSDARLILGDGAFAGLLDLSTAGDRSRLTGRLSGDTVDIAALAGAFGEALSGTSRPLWTATDADLRIEATRIAAGPVAAAGGPVDLHLGDKGAEIGLPHLSLGGGSGSAALTVKAGDRPAYVLKGKLEGARLASLAPLIGSVADGEINLAADVSAEGKKRDDLFKSATGSADFSIVHGTLDGLDPVALIGRLAHSVQTGFGSDRGRFGFDKLSGHVKLVRGLVTGDNLAFAAGNLQLTGAGTLGLAGGALDLRLKPTMKDYPDFEAPVAVVGPLAAPRLYPDLPGLIGDPTAGYAHLAAMTGGFARLIGGDAAPKLEAVGPDAMTSMIDKLAEPPKPVEESVAPEASVAPAALVTAVAPAAIVPPLPPVRPASLASLPQRGEGTARSPGLAGGPLDLGALGRTPASVAPTSARTGSCRPGRDGRCIP
ncbi:AsmA family protein [Pleomorphomonas oryzae]|uniref:AsmA family protein n=1 Tax=Pleomorphomonas oryzae TaxID=261934 RepID=UPI00040262EE|nr:AsmA-like C-terminal region-containing protein [Pleomorphomonas oryzae]